jgi:dienelactone hydrolase
MSAFVLLNDIKKGCAMLKKLLTIIFLPLMLCSCEQIVLDATDPFEKPGAYSTNMTGVSIDTSTSANNIAGVIYSPGGTIPAASRVLVVILPGFSLHYYDYEVYAKHLASHGYLVLAMDYVETSSDSAIAKHDDKALQVKEAISYMLDSSNVKSTINPEKIAVMGHSLGGKMAFYAAAIDHRIKSVIALDPSNAGGPPCAINPDNCANYPVAANPARGFIGVVKDITASSLIFRSQPDAFNPGDEFNAYNFYYGSDGLGLNGTPSPSRYIDMGAAPHANYMPKIITFLPTLVKRDVIAWLKNQFDGIDTSNYFTGSVMQADISAGRVSSTTAR